MPDRPLTSGAAMRSGWRRNVIKCDRNVREFRRLRGGERSRKPREQMPWYGASAEIHPKDDASRRIRLQSIAPQSVHGVSTRVSTAVSTSAGLTLTKSQRLAAEIFVKSDTYARSSASSEENADRRDPCPFRQMPFDRKSLIHSNFVLPTGMFDQFSIRRV